jgi:hypothetical protein
MMWRVLLPLLGLELKRYWLNPLRIVLSLAQPLMYLFILGAGLAGGTYALDSSYQAYIYPGIVAMALMFAAASAAVGVVHDRQVGVFKALLVSLCRAARWRWHAFCPVPYWHWCSRYCCCHLRRCWGWLFRRCPCCVFCWP